jgi:hypothetical protein
MSFLNQGKGGEIHVEPFEVVFDDILSKENIDDQIIDLCILGTYFFSPGLNYIVYFIVFTPAALHFYEL